MRMPFVTLPLRDSLSAWAKELKQVRIISLFIFEVSMFSFSKITGIPQLLRIRTCLMQSRVFRAKREIDFVRMRSIFFFLHSSNIPPKCATSCCTDLCDVVLTIAALPPSITTGMALRSNPASMAAERRRSV